MIKPIGDKVLVKPLEAEERSAGGIVLPDTAKEKPQRGEVIAVGEGRRLESGKLVPLEVKVGNKVLFSKYGGTEIKEGEDKYIILSISDIYAIIE